MAQDYYVTPAPKPSQLSRKTLIIGGGLIAAILVSVFLLLGSGGNNISKQLQHLSLRMGTLQALLDDPVTKKNLKNEDLSRITTDLKLTLTTSRNELGPIMTEAGLPPKFDSDIIASEADISTATKLEEAALNNRFDRAYAEALEQKIISLRALVAETYSLTKSIKLRQGLVTLDKTLKNANNSLDELNY